MDRTTDSRSASASNADDDLRERHSELKSGSGAGLSADRPSRRRK